MLQPPCRRQGHSASIMAKQRLVRRPAVIVPVASPAAGSAAASAASAIWSNFGPALRTQAASPLHVCPRPVPPSAIAQRIALAASLAAFSTKHMLIHCRINLHAVVLEGLYDGEPSAPSGLYYPHLPSDFFHPLGPGPLSAACRRRNAPSKRWHPL